MEKSNLKHAKEEGREEEKIKIAQNLLRYGLPVDLVIKTTSLSEAKIKYYMLHLYKIHQLKVREFR